jgi:transcriptional regulator with XRE-family HTH domain
MAARPSAADVDRVVGRNVRRVREERGASQDGLAQALRDAGWLAASDQVLIAVEKGTRSLRFAEVLLLADVLNVPIAALLEVPPGEWVRVGTRVPTTGPDLVRRLTEAPHQFGEQSNAWSDLEQARRDTQFSASGRHSWGDETKREAERHAASKLGVAPGEVVQRSYRLWGRTLSDERDARCATRASADATARQRATWRGHVTRELLTDLRNDIKGELELDLGAVVGLMDVLEDKVGERSSERARGREGPR